MLLRLLGLATVLMAVLLENTRSTVPDTPALPRPMRGRRGKGRKRQKA